jgi:hypothetical protein
MKRLRVVDVASTYGWDTAFGIRIADANAAIVKAGSSPKTFAVSDPQDGISACGTFGNWQITTGGSGELVRLHVPIAAATIESKAGTDHVDNATALVDVRLNLLHQQDPSGKTSHHLRVRTTAPSESVNVASVWKVNYPSGQELPFLSKAALQGLLELWLNQNLDDFDHVFATVDLNRRVDQQAFQWLQPTDVSYAYSDLAAADGMLAVLCMTGGRSSRGLIQQASCQLIPGRQRAGLAIAKERVLAQLILPAMPQVFPGSKSSDYRISDSGESILNAHQHIRFHVAPAGHKPHTAEIQELRVTIDGGEMQMEVLTKTEISPGIQAYCRTQNFLAIHLVNKPDGTQTLGYAEARPALTSHWTQTSPGIEITEEILVFAAVIGALIAVVVTDGAALTVVALIIGLIAGVMTLTTALIKDVGEGDAPPINELVLNATAAISWADSKDFQLGFAGLNDSLQLGGNLGFV